MNNNVTQFPIDPKRLVTFQIGSRHHVLVIPAVPLARRPNRAEVILISTARNRLRVQPAGA